MDGGWAIVGLGGGWGEGEAEACDLQHPVRNFVRCAIPADADKSVEQRHGASHLARVARVLSYERRDLNARCLKDWKHRIQSR